MQAPRRHAPLVAITLAVLLAGSCGGAGDGRATGTGAAVPGDKGDLGRDATAGPAPAGSGDGPQDTATRLPLGARPGFDDLDQNGSPDPTCTEHDYGGGLVLRLLCNDGDYAQAPVEGTTLVPESLFGLPSPDLDLTGISGSVGMGRTPDGRAVFVVFHNSDTLFEPGSADLSDPAVHTFTSIAALIARTWPTGAIEVRGHTDATESPPPAGCCPSDGRPPSPTSSPLTEWTGHACPRSGSARRSPSCWRPPPTGRTTPLGRQYDRRVEIAVTPG